ncbi:hypothetical protein [Virgibacillus alimentarius]|uniref:C2H2-type domain-containing protein n=1 Tax=Virgibacillus alimentarius TaxID=698769 RepID=A0ABS4SCB2_9BACI|nr:hypothetical protein [Virgibacillus alimentarius]MBP2259148.1 hypothetical protein [Virgibacillus alimentarius]
MGNIQFYDSFDMLPTDTLPDYCPVCMKSVHPEYILMHHISSESHELLCHCPNGECGSLFFAVYTESPFDNSGDWLEHLYPHNKYIKDFPKEVIEVSPEFKEIYNQAYHAEKEQLDMICGVGYRKALEHLIKDYIIDLYPDKEETVKVSILYQNVLMNI